MLTLDIPVEQLTQFGKKLAPQLHRLSIITARDLLFYLPYRWDDLSVVTPIAHVVPGALHTIRGRIEIIENRRSWKKRITVTSAIVADDTGRIAVIWFNQPFLAKNLHSGDTVYLSGKIEHGEVGLQFVSPEYEKLTARAPTHVARIVPRYPLTRKLSQKQLRFLVKYTLPLSPKIGEWLPLPLIRAHGLVSLPYALTHIHFPQSQTHLKQAQDRLKFDELFLIQLHAGLQKNTLAALRAPRIDFKEPETKQFVASLPFTLTAAQKKASWEIIKDLGRSRPMNRLLEGDVGSGKTVVAHIAILNVCRSRLQVAYMAPTEILARQIYEKMITFLAPHHIRIGLLIRSDCRGVVHHAHPGNATHSELFAKRMLLKHIAEGSLDLVVGTHALLSEHVQFHTLALVIVDEQHRFGVSQRAMLAWKSGYTPHFLSMSATPIPRSLALTVYGDLDLSVLDELPAGRLPIATSVVPLAKRKETYAFIEKAVGEGRQAYVICPLIDPSDTLGVRSATMEYQRLSAEIFPHARIGLLHGRMPAHKKESCMQAFYAGKLDILVSTTVVEVGIDVPNATIMVIEGAERFGLAQLHQLRGRVGRSEYQSQCFLFTESDSPDTIKRLHVVAQSRDGFAIADADLAFRGPGEVYGVKQAGFFDRLKIAKLTDYPVIRKARQAAEQILRQDPTLAKYPALKNKVGMWEKEIHLE